MKECPSCSRRAAKSYCVRDCLAYCSQCHGVIESIDFVHTCRGGELCLSCWKKAAPQVNTNADKEPRN